MNVAWALSYQRSIMAYGTQVVGNSRLQAIAANNCIDTDTSTACLIVVQLFNLTQWNPN